jgi:aminocarboxymuconate-semialdehyde decarboxylase
MEMIDVHAHVVLEETFGTAGTYGPELIENDNELPMFRVGSYCLHGVPYRNSPFMDHELRLKKMEKSNIGFQVLSPNPLTYFHFIDDKEAINFCRRHNDTLAKLISRYPEKLSGFAALPMQHIEGAKEELERSVKELGLLGAYIGVDLQTQLDHEMYDTFYEKVIELNVPLYLHPAPAGIDGPTRDERFKRFDLDLTIGFASDETLAVATLIYGGVMERHPDLDVCISHGGGASIYLCGRMAAAARKRPWSPGYIRADGAYEEVLSSLWFDSHVHSQKVFSLLKDTVGLDKLVFGTNFAGWDQGHAAFDEETSKILTDNARRLLRI